MDHGGAPRSAEVVLTVAGPVEEAAGGLEQVEVRAAIHAAEFLDGEDGKDGGGAVVEGEDPAGAEVGAGSGIQERGAFAKRAEDVAAFEKRDDPGERAEGDAAEEDPAGGFAWLLVTAPQGGGAEDQAEVVERCEKHRHPEGA